MSVLTTTPLKCAPSAANGVTVSYGTAPAFGAWVQVIASTAAPIAIAGLSFSNAVGSRPLTIQIGTGAAAAEAVIGTFNAAWEAPSDFVQGPDDLILPVPIGGIPAGTRVSVRCQSEIGTGPTGITLLYYESFSSNQVSRSSEVLSAAPVVDEGRVVITPSGSAWVSTNWLELLASAIGPIGLLGVSHSTVSGTFEDGYEIDLGLGAEGAETVITTLRDASYGANGRASVTWLPGVFPVTSGSRVSARLRVSSADTTPFGMALLYYTNVRRRNTITLPMFTTGGTTGPLSWIELVLKADA